MAWSPAALWLFNSPASFFYKGNFAVAVFFVLSGFVLSSVALRNAGELTYLAEATVKRYLRLGGPVAASIMLCFALKSIGLFNNGELGITAPLSNAYDAPADLLSAIRSALYGAMVFGDRSHNYVLWTISIEFYGSLMIFATSGIFAHSRKQFRIASAMIALLFLLLPGVLLITLRFSWVHFLPPSGFTLHAECSPGLRSQLVCIWGGYAAGSTSYAWLAGTANRLQSHGVKLNWPIQFMCIGAFLLLWAALLLNRIHALLKSRVLLWLGNVSFSLYLVHSLILTAISGHIIRHFGTGTSSFAISVLLVTACSLGLAHVFWRWADYPSMRAADRFGKWFTTVTRNGS